MGFDPQGNRIYGWTEVLLVLMNAAQRWGVMEPVPSGYRLRIVNWKLVNDEPTGDPGHVLLEPSDEGPGIDLQGSTFSRCSTEGTIDWIVKTANEAIRGSD